MADKKNDLRNIVLTMLAETLQEAKFSHLVVNETLETYDLDEKERSFVCRLYLGVLEKLIYLDYVINSYSTVNTQKMRPVVLNVLRMSVYQLLFMDAVPDYAVISEAGNLVSKRGLGSLKSFVNGVLRSVQKNGAGTLEMPENVRLSVPKWLYEEVTERFGKPRAEQFFRRSLNEAKGLSIRLNTLKGSPEYITGQLESEGCTVRPIKGAEELNCASLSDFSRLTALKAYKDGLFTVQDTSSVRAAYAGIKALKEEAKGSDGEGLVIVDVCAAPGGKSLCAAENFQKARIISRDLTQAKVSLIEENIARLGAVNIEPEVHDALVFDETLSRKADLVIADLPCSGLGVIGGKPDIKLRVRKKDVEELSKLQREILDVVKGYVKPGGLLLYSTCTITAAENDDNAAWLAEDGTFALRKTEQILPGDTEEGDGFFWALFEKNIP